VVGGQAFHRSHDRVHTPSAQPARDRSGDDRMAVSPAVSDRRRGSRDWRIRGLLDRAARALPSSWRGHLRWPRSRGSLCPPQAATRRRARRPLNDGRSSPSTSAARCCSSSL